MLHLYQKNVLLPVFSISLGLGLLGQFCPTFLLQIQYLLLAGLVVCIGLPHGATDFLLYRRIQGTRLTRTQVFRFFIFYLLAATAYFCAWLIWPTLSLLLFLLISVYHFGQSNWEQFDAPNWIKNVVNVAWGTFALGGSVLWHWDESSLIIAQLVPNLPTWSGQTMFNVQVFLLGINVVLIGGLRSMGFINQQRLLLELLKLVVLGFMLYFTPLLVGFTIYFTLWHSLGSLLGQVAFFRKKWPSFTILQYYRQATPFTLLALLGLFGMVMGQPYLFPNISLLSVFIVFTSCITLPHIFLIEESYK